MKELHELYPIYCLTLCKWDFCFAKCFGFFEISIMFILWDALLLYLH